MGYKMNKSDVLYLVEIDKCARADSVITLYERDYFRRGPSKREDLINLMKEVGLTYEEATKVLDEQGIE